MQTLSPCCVRRDMAAFWSTNSDASGRRYQSDTMRLFNDASTWASRLCPLQLALDKFLQHLELVSVLRR